MGNKSTGAHMGLVSEFREFALKGNVIDLAVGVIIGGAFALITNSMVSDLLMPPIGRLVGRVDFTNMYVSLSDKVDEANAKIAATQPSVDGVNAVMHGAGRLPLAKARELGPVLAYGNFITILINFIILVFCVFLVVKAMNTAKRRFEKQQQISPPPPTRQEELLAEIRDALKARNP
jgi:large conductance mechanosensitive channel